MIDSVGGECSTQNLQGSMKGKRGPELPSLRGGEHEITALLPMGERSKGAVQRLLKRAWWDAQHGPGHLITRISITLSLCLHPDLAGGLSWLLKTHTSSRESWGLSRPAATSHAVYAGIWRTRNWMGEIMGRAVGRDDRDQPASWIRCAGFVMPYAHRLITKKFVRKEARLLESAGSGKSRSA